MKRAKSNKRGKQQAGKRLVDVAHEEATEKAEQREPNQRHGRVMNKRGFMYRPEEHTIAAWGVAVAAVVAAIYCLQLFTMHQALQTDQRAWLKITRTLKGVDVAEGKPIADAIVVTNTGKTPARLLHIEAVIKIVNNGDPITFGYLPDTNADIGSLFPGETSENATVRSLELRDGKAVTKLLTASEISNLKSGMAFAVEYSRVSYKDIFGTEHQTRRCDWIPLAGGDYWAHGCADYNGTDDNK